MKAKTQVRKAITERGAFAFQDVLPRLVAAYETGRLTPFIGVGMSRPHCADWPGLIGGLESSADIQGLEPLGANTKSEDLIRRADRAIRKLRAKGPEDFERALGGALFAKRDPIPRQMEALASIWWPLVVTTNYDNFYVKAFDNPFDARGLAVVGRGSEDCQRVLTSLSTAGRALLWAIQGHLAGPCVVKGHESDRRLAKELVIDHTEYRRVTHREPHFRRAFAEVFRHRSLLFLGSGLRETYLQELFGEVLELYGPSSRTHYAIMPRGEVDPQFMYAKFQIAVVEYDSSDPSIGHSYVPDCLAELRENTERSDAAPVSWSWGQAETRDGNAAWRRADLEVVRGPLPRVRIKDECLVVSAGGKLDESVFYVSSAIRPTLNEWNNAIIAQPHLISRFVGEYSDCDAFAVRARREHDDAKDLLAIREASLALFAGIAAHRYHAIHMQLLATGGNDQEEDDEPSWTARPFPARFAFVETVRAWGEWRRNNLQQDCRLVLHVVDPSVYREIVSGRIDVLELLQCEDIRFWTEIVEEEVLLERRQFQRHDSTNLGALVEELCLDPQRWNVEVSPPTGIGPKAGPVSLDHRDNEDRLLTLQSIRDLGVVPGSTLHFRRILPDSGR